MDYHISIQEFKVLLKNNSFFDDISEKLPYNDVLEKTTEWLVENNIVCMIEDLEKYVSTVNKIVYSDFNDLIF